MAKRNSRADSSRSSGKDGSGNEYLYGKGPTIAAAIRIGRTASRVAKHAARLKSYGLPDPTIVEDLQEAHKCLRSAEAKLGKVPKNWRPVRGTLGATPLEEGSYVMVKEGFTSRYEDDFDTDKPVKIVKIRGARITVAGKYEGANVRTGVLRSHVQSVSK